MGQKINVMGMFDEWWYDIGSGMRPGNDEDFDEFVRRIAEESWRYSGKIHWNLAIDESSERGKAKIESVKDKSGRWYKTSVVIKKSILKLKR